MSIYDFQIRTTAGGMASMEQFRGKVLLIVNTATGCGFTPQYEGLEALYRKYGGRGLEILDFPCNQFGRQAPGTDAEIDSFCRLNYDTSFPRFARVEVNGAGAEPLFTFLKQQKPGVGGSAVKWNFTKFLVDREGRVAGRFAPVTAPEKLEEQIERLL